MDGLQGDANTDDYTTSNTKTTASSTMDLCSKAQTVASNNKTTANSTMNLCSKAQTVASTISIASTTRQVSSWTQTVKDTLRNLDTQVLHACREQKSRNSS